MKKFASVALLGALAIPAVFAAKTETKPPQQQTQTSSSKKHTKKVRKHHSKTGTKTETKKS